MITLQFAAEPKIGSELIRWFTQGSWSHVDTVLPDGTLLGARMNADGAAGPGVQIRSAGYLGAGARVQRLLLPCSAETEALFYAELHKELGKPYDWQAIAAFAAGRDWRNPEAWFCSELQAAKLEIVHVLPRLVVPADKLSPDSLFLVAAALYPNQPFLQAA